MFAAAARELSFLEPCVLILVHLTGQTELTEAVTAFAAAGVLRSRVTRQLWNSAASIASLPVESYNHAQHARMFPLRRLGAERYGKIWGWRDDYEKMARNWHSWHVQQVCLKLGCDAAICSAGRKDSKIESRTETTFMGSMARAYL